MYFSTLLCVVGIEKIWHDARKWKTLLALTLTAMPFRSDEPEAAVGEVLGTVFVLVSLIRILDTGIPKHLDATYEGEVESCYHCNGRILLLS